MKRNKIVLLLTIICLACLTTVAFVACNPEKTEREPTEYTITFFADGGTHATVTTAGNETITMPNDPTRDGYVFCGWYVDPYAWETPFTASSLSYATLTSNLWVYAKFAMPSTLKPDIMLTDEWQVTVEATCTARGTEERINPYTGKKESREITALGHAYGEYITTKEPTCDAEGSKIKTCIRCQNIVTESIAVKHTFDADDLCTVCGVSNLRFDTFDPSCVRGFYNTDIFHTKLVIPNYNNGVAVTKIEGLAFFNYTNRSLERVILPDSITTIGVGAFIGCSSLTSITLPDSVTTIGADAFKGCSSLTSITIPNGVTLIDDNTFEGCSSLTSITIPDSVTTIGNYAFSRCSSLTTIAIPNSVTSIGKETFSYCDGLTSITIPDSVTKIGNYAFFYCLSLTSVTIGDGVTAISDGAFRSCHNLTSITLSDSVTSIGNGAFSGCISLVSIAIPDSVTSICDSAFDFCSSLTSIIIPNSVTSIGEDAFFYCCSLTSVYYQGTADDWLNINIDDDGYDLSKATLYYFSESEPALNSAGTAYNGNYWHYVDGEVVVWKIEN